MKLKGWKGLKGKRGGAIGAPFFCVKTTRRKRWMFVYNYFSGGTAVLPFFCGLKGAKGY